MNEDLKHVDVLPPAVRQYVEQLVGRAMMDRFGIEVTGTKQGDRAADAGEALEGATVDELLAALVSHPDLALDEYGLKANRDVALGLDIARVLAKHL